MTVSVSLLRDIAQAMGLKIPEERLPAVAAAMNGAQAHTDAIRTLPTPTPEPTPFDAAWNGKK